MYPDFQHPQRKNEKTRFKNGYFENTSNRTDTYKVLEYSENTNGWNDKLTEIALHDINKYHPIDVASREKCIELLEKYEDSKKKIVLEIGCANGHFISEIQKLKRYNYIGSDAQSSRVFNLANKYNNIPFIVFDLLKNPFSENFFDNVVMLNVLEHIKEDQRALCEVHRMLKKNGLLIIEVPSGSFLYDDYDVKLLHFRRYDMKDLINKLSNAGFKIEKKTHLGFLAFPFFLIIKLFNKFFKKKLTVTKSANISDNTFLKILFKIEKKLGSLSLPFGVRCYVCARKK